MADKERNYWEKQLADIDLSRLSGSAGNLSAMDMKYVGKFYSALKSREEFRERFGLAPVDTRSCTISYARRLGATEKEAEAVILGLEGESEMVKLQEARLPGGLFKKIKRFLEGKHK